ncbi:Na(+)-translocating NADH-quinone reductase subunit A [Desulfosarcina ovata subsp. sediminis]|uniref:Na(+)-translocating NADH-quinone reductase subunit A n=1 Tax=Desulfosarcina ovata subsp. sediminis TaxID=885957 RepID=A0A5K7ZS44_9BACT|nr:4Fe-4S dicluster domain-containing protein [Desulfosarcina ovata]BBO83030.1 Na(+)-translocating NADH-quinone reductase subunit A [Desulfosarcina ovata subsp. sediminis]
MNAIHLKKGFSPRIAGTPGRRLQKLEKPRHVGMVPKQIPFIKPRLLVKEGDAVRIGTPLFEDKRNPRIRFLSPGGGTVTRIAFGPRRVIEAVVITLDDEEFSESFDKPATDQLATASRAEWVDLLLAGGMWPFLRSLPFMDLADPDFIPPAIIVRLGDDEPFAPDPVVYLEGREDDFSSGMDLLGRLCERVILNLTGDDSLKSQLSGQMEMRCFSGPYPSGNPAVQLYRTKKGADENRAWFIDGQAVILLGQFLRTGRYPLERIVTVGGSLAPEAGHLLARAGVPLRMLAGGGPLKKTAARYIVGGLFTGFSGSEDSYLGFYQNALNLIDDGDREEPFAFIRPGADKPSYSTAFLSALRKKPFPMDCSQHGEQRACVNCGTCARICPVDILPQFTMKCLVADEVEEALAHGLLDCAECGLCTYACPSKIELCEVLRSAKAQYYKEIA